MAKKKFDFTEKEKSVDELFEEQFKIKESDGSSALPPDIPISLKDINKIVNADAQNDEGMLQEEVREQVVDVEDEEGAYDLEEMNEESVEEIEEELDELEQKKKKRKKDREKGRKNEKAYQEQTRKLDAETRLHEEEMRMHSERMRQQEELTASERRNRELMDDDYEISKQSREKAQQEKIDNLVAEHRRKEEQAKNYEGFENKNLDFSGRNEHGHYDAESKSSSSSDHQETYKTGDGKASPSHENDTFRSVEPTIQQHSSEPVNNRSEDRVTSTSDTGREFHQNETYRKGPDYESRHQGSSHVSEATHPDRHEEPVKKTDEHSYTDYYKREDNQETYRPETKNSEAHYESTSHFRDANEPSRKETYYPGTKSSEATHDEPASHFRDINESSKKETYYPGTKNSEASHNEPASSFRRPGEASDHKTEEAYRPGKDNHSYKSDRANDYKDIPGRTHEDTYGRQHSEADRKQQETILHFRDESHSKAASDTHREPSKAASIGYGSALHFREDRKSPSQQDTSSHGFRKVDSTLEGKEAPSFTRPSGKTASEAERTENRYGFKQNDAGRDTAAYGHGKAEETMLHFRKPGEASTKAPSGRDFAGKGETKAPETKFSSKIHEGIPLRKENDSPYSRVSGKKDSIDRDVSHNSGFEKSNSTFYKGSNPTHLKSNEPSGQQSLNRAEDKAPYRFNDEKKSTSSAPINRINKGSTGQDKQTIVSGVIGKGSDLKKENPGVINNSTVLQYGRDIKHEDGIRYSGKRIDSVETGKQGNKFVGSTVYQFTSKQENKSPGNHVYVIPGKQVNKASGNHIRETTYRYKANSTLHEEKRTVRFVRLNDTKDSKFRNIINNVKTGNSHFGEFSKNLGEKTLKPLDSIKGLLNREDKSIIINEKGIIISKESVKRKYASSLGKGFYRAGDTVFRSLKGQVINAFRENDSFDNAVKVKTIGAGVLAISAVPRMLGHNAVVSGDFIKAKGNSVLNAGRYFKGQELKQLKLIPRTEKQLTLALQVDRDLISIKTEKLLAKKKKLLKLQKAGKLSDAEAKLLGRIENHLKLRNSKKRLLLDKKKIGRMKDVLSMLSSAVLSSGDLSAQAISTGLTTTRYLKRTLKFSRAAQRLSFKASGMVFRKTAKTVGKIPGVKNAGKAIKGTVLNSKPGKFVSRKTFQANQLKTKVKFQLNGGIYNSAKGKINKVLPDKIKKTVVKLNGKKVGLPKFKKPKKIVNGARKVKTILTAPFRAISSALNWIKGKIAFIAAIGVVIYCCMMGISMVGGLISSMIFTDTDNLQKYVDSLNQEKLSWMSQIRGYQNQGGQKHGKYKQVTVNYVDENGRQLSEISNMKEILSMVAVHIENEWPDWYEFIDSSKVDNLAIQLWNDSHKVETTEIGPYSCDGCEERDYKCTDPLPSDASAERIELHNQYASQGGCIPYQVTVEYVKSSISNSEWPKRDIVFTWNSEDGEYQTEIDSTTYVLWKPFEGDTLIYEWNSSDDCYELMGTREETRYKCDGHHEIYCPKDHYDLIVNAIVIHLPSLYEYDSNSLGVVEDYPDDAVEGDFYWDKSNREWCENIYNQDWNSLYEGLTGLEQSSVSGEPLTTEEIEKYLGDISDLNLSEDRLRVLETALSAVGKIPYYWGGYATCPGFEGNNFGTPTTPDESGRDLKGLDCSHFVDWVCWTALGNNLGNSWTGAIWDQTTSVSLMDLKPGDLGFQNEGGNSVNHVGFYLGNGLWVHCTAGGDNVVVNSTTVFTYYRRLNIMSN